MTREEAIEVVKKNYPHVSFSGSQFESALRELVPELRDSEDEKIIKEIIGYLNSRVPIAEETELLYFKRWISYLEKQKEQPKEELVYRLNGFMQEYIKEGKDEAEKEHRFKCYHLFWDALEDENFFEQKEQKPNVEICPHSTKSKSYKENGCPFEDCDYGLEIAYDILKKTFGEVRGYQTDDGIREHQTAIKAVRKAKEQKPAEKQDYSDLNDTERAILRGFLAAGVENVPVTIIKETAQECLAQMKPAEWNDTDMKEARDNLISVCRDWERGKQTALLPIVAIRARYFLEHLADPMPAEWSEEDETKLRDVIRLVEYSGHVKSIREHYEKFLTSLPERFNLRPSWKPSEAQINALHIAAVSSKTDGTVLTGLLVQLKELM